MWAAWRLCCCQGPRGSDGGLCGGGGGGLTWWICRSRGAQQSAWACVGVRAVAAHSLNRRPVLLGLVVVKSTHCAVESRVRH